MNSNCMGNVRICLVIFLWVLGLVAAARSNFQSQAGLESIKIGEEVEVEVVETENSKVDAISAEGEKNTIQKSIATRVKAFDPLKDDYEFDPAAMDNNNYQKKFNAGSLDKEMIRPKSSHALIKFNPMQWDSSRYTYESWFRAYESRTHGSKLLPIHPRYMVGWTLDHPGFCGEASLQSAALFYGNYLSQAKIYEVADVRDGHQYVLGKNAVNVAHMFGMYTEKFEYQLFDNPHKNSYIAWLKSEIDDGHPILAAFYDSVQKDPDFDHICPIIGYGWDDKTKSVTGFYYNDLIRPAPIFMPIDKLFQNRSTCQSPEDNHFCLPYNVTYGVSIMGNDHDLHNEMVPARLVVNIWFEPECEEGMNCGPYKGFRPVPIKGHLFISSLVVGKFYTCVRFDDRSDLPKHRNFLRASFKKRYDFIAQEITHTLPVETMSSSGTYFFRCFETPETEEAKAVENVQQLDLGDFTSGYDSS